MKNIVIGIGLSLAVLTIISFVGYFVYCKCFNNYLNKSLNNQVRRKNHFFPRHYLCFICLPIFICSILYWSIFGVISTLNFEEPASSNLEYVLKDDDTYKVIGIEAFIDKELIIPKKHFTDLSDIDLENFQIEDYLELDTSLDLTSYISFSKTSS